MRPGSVERDTTNRWGFSGMSGNIGEICWDEFDESTYKTRIQQEEITYNPSQRDSDLVLSRGGSFIESKWENTVFDRGTECDILDQSKYMGLRLVRNVHS